jgi:3-deoxy-D-manno-octulosonate 8-phosphate phosphatase (KDO 8-P phosphatase)
MMDQRKTLQERCQAIELLIVDVDGVLTDGGIVYTDGGQELKAFHVRDGSGIKIWRQQGKQAAIITGRSSPIVAQRAAELGIDPVIQGVPDKLRAFWDILAATRLQPEQICFIGDDLPDVPVLRHCGLAVAVADASVEARAEAHYLTHAAGGRGAVREVIQLILSCQGRWQTVIDHYCNQQL